MHTERQKKLVCFLKELRSGIIQKFEEFEPEGKKFQKNPWEHHSGGGGEIALLRGDVFEKAAVNWSGVHGEKFPTEEAAGPFFATGVSLITHMANPHAPTVHFNIRYIETPDRSWFGGGYDLTPMGFPYEEDTRHFHKTAREALAPFGEGLYEKFSAAAKEYFYIPHRKKERGVGGIFFDHYHSGDYDQDEMMWRCVGETFLDAVLPIYRKRAALPFTEKEKEKQQRLRAHYVEYNLIYDRGTRFGFLSGGNPEAILCSMPPVAKW